MITETFIKDSLSNILVPGAMRSVNDLNLLRAIEVGSNRVNIELAAAAINEDAQAWIRNKIVETLEPHAEKSEIAVSFTEASPKDINQVKKVVAVMSGKGGVGKSLISSLLGISLSINGMQAGILDADITGPSIPKMFGLGRARPSGSSNGIIPVLSKTGIGVMSINLVLENEDDAVIWRGPLIGKAIQQFWQDTLWGNLDCLVVDLPPGTADAPLTVIQSLPVSGVVLVFSPQELAAMVVRKALKMTRQMNVPILGVVENMSYFVLPDSGKKMELFGKSRGAEMAELTGSPLLAQLPIDPQLAQLCDEGKIEKYRSPDFEQLSGSFIQALNNL